MKRTFKTSAKIAAVFSIAMTLTASISPILANEAQNEPAVEITEEGYYRRLCTTEQFQLPGSCALQSSESVAQTAVVSVNNILNALF